jgi:hypothetical protein
MEEVPFAKKVTPSPFALRDPKLIPPRQWLYGTHLIRGFVSLTVAPGGLGKSSMVLVEALAMATGRDLLGIQPRGTSRVWVWNGEDPKEELERRIAAASIHYGIDTDQLGDRLLVDSGRTVPICLVKMDKGGVSVAEPQVDELITAIREHQIDVLVVDPFVTTHSVSENDTTGMNAVVAIWRKIADVTNCAIELVHHVSKAGAMNGDEMGIYASRGAGALIDGVRSARFLTRPSDSDASLIKLENGKKHYFKVRDGKSNLAPGAFDVWMRMIGVPLGNSTGFWTDGDTVGVCTAYNPEAVEVILSDEEVALIVKAIGDPESAPRHQERATGWVGYVVADALGVNIGFGLKKQDQSAEQRKARQEVRAKIGLLMKAGALTTKSQRNPRDGRDVTVVVVKTEETAEA